MERRNSSVGRCQNYSSTLEMNNARDRCLSRFTGRQQSQKTIGLR
ncbi:MAG: hypothetical protein PVF20_03070 [Desulfobacterales bacterium]